MHNNVELPASKIEKQVRFGLTVDVCLLGYADEQFHVMTHICDMKPFIGKISILGDIVYPNETLAQAAKRTLNIFTGIEDLPLIEIGAFDALDRHPLSRVITVAFMGVISTDWYERLKGPQPLASWIPVHEIDTMAFDHIEILRKSLKTLPRYLDEPDFLKFALPEKFSLSQLRKFHEVALKRPLDKRNFRKQLFSSDLVISTGEIQQKVKHRPAELYQFTSSKSSVA